MNCPNCGGTIHPGANRCQKCGSYVEQPAAASAAPQPPVPPAAPQPQPPTSPPKSKLTAGLLGIFLGAWGVHRFYLGHTGIGVAQLVLTLVGLLTICCFYGLPIIAAWIWGLIEGILILTGQINQDAWGRPLTS